MEYVPGSECEEELSSSRSVYVKWAAGVFLFAAVFFFCGFLFARLMPDKKDPLGTAEEVLRDIRSDFYYYDEETDKAISDGALKGMAAYLDDPYSEYFTAEEYAELQQSDSGSYVGVGILIQREDDGTVRVASVYDDGPADKAGLMAEDVLISVNGTSTGDLSLDDITALFCCGEGEENTLVILRSGEMMTLTVIAGEVYVPYVHARMLSERIGYIHISGFHGKVTEEVKEALNELTELGMDRLILDVRDNLGGTLSDVCKIAGLFLPDDSLITTLRSRKDKERIYRTNTEGIFIPIAMLVNGSSASASELLAGALHDNGAAVLFGTKTYGKGIVQTYYELDEGRNGAFKMTTQAYFTPAGVCIQDEGITPDHTVEMPEDLFYEEIYELTLEEDPQLSEALRYLEER